MKTNVLNENQVLKTNIEAIRSVMALVRTTIGPKGLDVMLVDEFGHSTCTNDGVEILSNVQLQHPAAKLAVEATSSQEIQSGDGTTTCAIYIDSMLASALKQVELGHKANRIAEGIKIATEQACELLEKNSKKITTDSELRSLISISARQDSEITELVFQAITGSHRHCEKDEVRRGNLQINNLELDLSDHVVASLNNKSQILDGLFIKKKTHFSFPNIIKDAPLLLIEGPFEPESMASEVVSTEEGVRKYENNLQSLLDTAKKIVKAGTQVILTGSSMYPSIEEYFIKEGVLVLTHVSKKHLQNIASLTKAKILSRPKLIHGDLNSINKNLGKVESAQYLDELGGFLFKTSESIKTILISAQMQSSLDEKERIVIDALKAGQNAVLSGYVLGEGIAEMNIISSLNYRHCKEEGQSNLPVNDLAVGFTIIQDALRSILWQIIDNAGLDYKEAISQIKFNADNKLGINLDSGKTIDLEEAGIIDPLKAKLSALRIATELTIQVLRINAIVQSK